MLKTRWVALLIAAVIGMPLILLSGARASDAEVRIIASSGQATAFLGSQVTFTASATGISGTIQWQWQRSSDGTVWHNVTMPGADSARLTFIARDDRLAYSYRASAACGDEIWYSNAVRVRLIAQPVVSVTASRTSATLGDEVTLTGAAAETEGAVAWQWQRSQDEASWSDISWEGARTAVLRFTANQDRLSYRYRLRVTDDNGAWYSEAVSIAYIESLPITVSVEPAYPILGETVTLTAQAAGAAGLPAYHWQSSSDGTSWTWLNGTGSRTRNLNFMASEKACALQYRVSVTDENGTWFSEPVQAVLIPAARVTTAADRESALEGGTVILSASAEGTSGELQYGWQYSVDGLVWETLENERSQTMRLEATEENLSKTYRSMVTDVHRSWHGNAVRIRFIPAATVQRPVVYLNGKTLIRDATVTDYDDVKNGPLTLTWTAQNGNGEYAVRALLLDEDPVFQGSQQSAAQTLLDAVTTDTSLTIDADTASRARYLKVWISARDRQYALNGGTSAMAFAVRFTPSAVVTEPAVTANALGQIPSMQMMIYDVDTNGDLTLTWTLEGGNGRCSIRALLVDEVPDLLHPAQHIVKTVLHEMDTARRSLTVPADQLRLASYLKVWISAQDARYSQNGGSAAVNFALRLGSEESRESGDGLRWRLADGCLTLSGTGAMQDYAGAGAPWYLYRGSVRRIVVEPGVTGIGQSAFSGMNAVEAVILPEGLARIGSRAFEGCGALTELRLPKALTEIANEAFSGLNEQLTLLTPPYSRALAFAKEQGFAWRYVFSVFSADLALPGGLKTIEAEAFEGIRASGVRIPEGTEAIGGRAFADCRFLTMVYIPATVNDIAADAFSGVPELTVYTPAGSEAQRWAAERDIPCCTVGTP